MKVINNIHTVETCDRGAVAAIGNFDGVHQGHQAVLAQMRILAQQMGAPSAMMTFFPHPRRFFKPDAPAFELMSNAQKRQALDDLGIDILFEIAFDRSLANHTADAFAQDIIVNALGLRHVIIGDDFHFGKNREGTPQILQALGQQYGFGVTIAGEIAHDRQRVSSSAIRKALTEGQPKVAAQMLGRPYAYCSTVLHGEKRGRELGYPTANMDISGRHLPCFGVYAVKTTVMPDHPLQGRYDGVASLGIRPTFDGETPNLETFIFDFEGDLYDAMLHVELIEFLRPEIRFSALEDLISQMDQDSIEARIILRDLK